MGGGYFLVKVTGKNLREMVSQGRTRRDQCPILVMIQMSGGSVKTGKAFFPGVEGGGVLILTSYAPFLVRLWEWLNGTGNEISLLSLRDSLGSLPT